EEFDDAGGDVAMVFDNEYVHGGSALDARRRRATRKIIGAAGGGRQRGAAHRCACCEGTLHQLSLRPSSYCTGISRSASSSRQATFTTCRVSSPCPRP